MKKLVLVALAASGILLCQTNQTGKISGFEREALETQSPPVHPGSKHHKSNKHRTDRVVSDKQTINAYIPVGK